MTSTYDLEDEPHCTLSDDSHFMSGILKSPQKKIFVSYEDKDKELQKSVSSVSSVSTFTGSVNATNSQHSIIFIKTFNENIVSTRIMKLK